MPSEDACRIWLDNLALDAWQGEGYVEPGVMVGCAIVPAGETVEVPNIVEHAHMGIDGRYGRGHYQAYGGPHAEVVALEDAKAKGLDVRGATVFVTLEPCNHWGKTGPCSEALINADVARVICARADTTELASGGAQRLRDAGIDVVFTDASQRAIDLSEPFFHREATGLPWVIGKWAQTIDGKGATSSGESQWLTSDAARRSVHGLRAGVDAILTGIGTVLTDDPTLTARGVPLKRVATRVVIDPKLETPTVSGLVRTIEEAPVLLVCAEGAPKGAEKALTELGVRVVRVPTAGGLIDLREMLAMLAREEGVATVMTEGGSRLMGRLHDAGLFNELRVYIAPMVMGDPASLASVQGRAVAALEDVVRWRLVDSYTWGDDVELRYRRRMTNNCP